MGRQQPTFCSNVIWLWPKRGQSDQELNSSLPFPSSQSVPSLNDPTIRGFFPLQIPQQLRSQHCSATRPFDLLGTAVDEKSFEDGGDIAVASGSFAPTQSNTIKVTRHGSMTVDRIDHALFSSCPRSSGSGQRRPSHRPALNSGNHEDVGQELYRASWRGLRRGVVGVLDTESMNR